MCETPKCLNCGKQTKVYASSGLPKKYCSQRCREVGQYGRREIQAKQCERCGKAFKTKTDRKHCSESCAKASRREKSSETFASKRIAKCLACGKEFVARKKKYMTCCSRECGWEYVAAKRRALNQKKCVQCFDTFNGSGDKCNNCCRIGVRFGMRLCNCIDCRVSFPRIGNPTGKNGVRCEQCRISERIRRGREWYKGIRAKVHIQGSLSIHEYRAHKYGVESEHVDPIAVFERDKWVCQICKKKTKPSDNPKHPLRASLDHLIPLSRGGPHLYRNCQCAHNKCNLSKGSKIRRQQLLLIG